MSFVKNDRSNEQLSLRDPWAMLSEREKQFLEKSWAKYFAEFVFPNPHKAEKTFQAAQNVISYRKKQRWDSCGTHYRKICGRNSGCINLL